MRRFQFELGVVLFGSALLACGGSGSRGSDTSPENSQDASHDGSILVDGGARVPDASEETGTSVAPGMDGSASSSDGWGDTTVTPEGDGAADGTILEASVPADAVYDGPVQGGPADANAEGGPADANAEGGPADSGEAGSYAPPQIVVDQFGYRTSAAKLAVVRSAHVGYDALPFVPGTAYVVVDANSGTTVFPTGSGVLTPVAWNGGATDTSSGDSVWWVDFSAFTTPGTYFVRDVTRGVVSDTFRISDAVYNNVLVQAARAFYYQRDGIAKLTQYAGAWSDTVEHPQDTQCSLYGGPDASATVDLHGGWFNAGDENKYTTWAASNAIQLLRAYAENPAAFAICDGGGCTGDSYNIPESGNGVPDILDEAKWGLDWLGRMQDPVDGSVRSLVGNSTGSGTTNGASPPSLDAAPCIYGPATTSATWSAAAAFAYGSIVFQSSNPGYAAALKSQAILAWNWAAANSGVTFYNLGILASYEQQLDATGTLEKQVQAAVFLFELTGSWTYRTVIDANYAELESSFVPDRLEQLDTLLEYTKASGATSTVVDQITNTFESNVVGTNNFGTFAASTDPYLAYIPSYAFVGAYGSNHSKTEEGNLFYDLVAFQVDSSSLDASADAGSAAANAARYAEGYVHYLHGVNPLGLVYLTNMGAQGATRSLTGIFSYWFTPAFALPPPPGFIAAGPNPAYTWDYCCSNLDGVLDAATTTCGSPQNNALCGAAPLAPPAGQPDQKSYRDFNSDWPLDSWEVSEANNANMAEYIRLVSKFVP